MTGAEQLSGLDDAFLYVESERTPMHMATIAIFEGGPLHRPDGSLRFDDVVALVQSRMDLLPKLRRKPQRELLGQGPLVWVDDEDFDVRHHLRVMTLDPPGTDEQLMALAGEVLATPLDRAHPLWEIVLVDGLREGRVGLIERLHHSMADGVAAAELGAVLLGLEPDESPPDPPRSWVAEPHAVGEAVVQRLGVLLGAPVRLASRGVDVARHPGQAVQHASDLLRSVATLATPRTLAPRSSLNVQIGPKKEVRAVRLVFEDIHTIAQEAGATVNDVFLTLVSGGLRELLSARGELKEDTEVQVMVPVNLVSGRGGALGNRVSGLFVRIPVAVEDATDALARIAARVRWDRAHHQELAPDLFLRLLTPLPQAVLSRLTALVHHQPLFNLVVTNVPGPGFPLYLLGAKMLEAIPVVPLAGNLTLGVAGLSYDGKFTVGLLADPEACPDLDRFVHGMEQSLEHLRRHGKERVDDRTDQP